MTIRPLAESEFPKPLLFCCTNRQRAAGCAVFQAAPGAAGLRLRWRPSCALRPLDGAGELDPRRYAHLAEDVPQVGLDGLLAEEQLVRDLRVGLAVDHEHGELELAFGQRLERRPGRPARPRALLNAMPELPQLPLRLAAVARSSGLPEVVGGTSELGYGALTVTRLGERAARKQARERTLDGRSRFVGGRRGRECSLGCTLGVATLELHGCRGPFRPGGGHRQLHGRGPGPRGGRGTFRLCVAIEREPTLRQHLEVPRSWAPGDKCQLFAT